MSRKKKRKRPGRQCSRPNGLLPRKAAVERPRANFPARRAWSVLLAAAIIAAAGVAVYLNSFGGSVFLDDLGHGRGPSESLVELADGQEAGVGADESATKIGDDGFTGVEVEGTLCSTVCHAKASLPCGLRVIEHPHSTRLWRPLLCTDGQNS
jgi:hypothetical protein